MVNSQSEMLVIGAGGFGVVKLKEDPSDKKCNTVVKFIKKHNECEAGEKEYKAMVKVYEKFQEHSKNAPQRCNFNSTTETTDNPYDIIRRSVYIPKPIAFSDAKQVKESYGNTFKPGEGYLCAFEMEYVKSGRSDKLQEHLILNETEQKNSNSVWLVKPCDNSNHITTEKLKAMDEEQRLHYGPRGLYLCKRSLQARINRKVKGGSIHLFAYAVGLLHGYVYASGYVPHDVEIVIDKNNDIAMYDFTFIDRGEYNLESADYDHYIPVDIEGRKEYLRGVYEILGYDNHPTFDEIAQYLLDNADDADREYSYSEFKMMKNNNMSGGKHNICKKCYRKLLAKNKGKCLSK